MIDRSLSAEPLTLSQKEFSKRLGVGEKNVRTAVKEGRIHALRFGRRICIPTSELQRLLTPAAVQDSLTPADEPAG